MKRVVCLIPNKIFVLDPWLIIVSVGVGLFSGGLYMFHTGDVDQATATAVVYALEIGVGLVVGTRTWMVLRDIEKWWITSLEGRIDKLLCSIGIQKDTVGDNANAERRLSLLTRLMLNFTDFLPWFISLSVGYGAGILINANVRVLFISPTVHLSLLIGFVSLTCLGILLLVLILLRYELITWKLGQRLYRR